MKPNIIFIMADDLGYGDLGCYGAKKIRTPNIDGIAEQGMRFTDLHSSSAVCTPSRYSLMTGRYCWRSWLKSYVLGGFGAPLISPERLTLASMLKDQGYHTAAVGKWHLGLDWYKKDGTLLSKNDLINWNTDGFDVDYRRGVGGGPLELGFDYWFGISGSLDMPPYCFLEGTHPVSIPDREKEPYNPQQRRGLMSEGWRDELVDVEFAGKAVDFIENHATQHHDSPFFLYLTPSSPHRPCLPPDFIRGKSDAGARGDMVELFDWVVGEILMSLEKNKLKDNTLIVVTSDNGARLTNYDGRDYGHKSNGDLRGGKGDIYDGGHREPFVARWPGHIPSGFCSDELLCLTDFLATCAEITGYDLPFDAGEDSLSFLSCLTGKVREKPLHEAVVHHAYDGMFAVRMGPWKAVLGSGSGGFSEPRRYIPEPGEPEGQLYNINDDSREHLNRWSERPEVVDRLKKVLESYQDLGRSR